jgi:hypothetical protein
MTCLTAQQYGSHMRKRGALRHASGSSTTYKDQTQQQQEWRDSCNQSMRSTSMLTLTPLLTIQNHVTFVMTPSRSFIPTMAATPWWTEHSHKSGTPASMQRWYVIDSAWWNMITLHYLTTMSHTQSSRMTRSSSPALDSWLTPEVLQELALLSSPKCRHQSLPPAASPRHPNLNPLTPNQKL